MDAMGRTTPAADAQSQPFSILSAPSGSMPAAGLPDATVTATITALPNPTQQFALTLNGVDTNTATTAQIAGNVGAVA